MLRTALLGVKRFAWRIIDGCKAFRARRPTDTAHEKLVAESDEGHFSSNKAKCGDTLIFYRIRCRAWAYRALLPFGLSSLSFDRDKPDTAQITYSPQFSARPNRQKPTRKQDAQVSCFWVGDMSGNTELPLPVGCPLLFAHWGSSRRTSTCRG